jgi:hypothetical protein
VVRIEEDDIPYSFRKDIDYAKIARKAEEERRIAEKIKADREEEKKYWKYEEAAERDRKKKEREAILLEAKLEDDRKKKEAEELRRKILKDEEERKEKEKEKKKAEEEEFERKVKERFMKAGKLFSHNHSRASLWHGSRWLTTLFHEQATAPNTSKKSYTRRRKSKNPPPWPSTSIDRPTSKSTANTSTQTP